MIVGTAGHVDHGKTALVRALTGVDTDRLKEEKARGITIDLGFAYMAGPGEDPIGFIDVPGHERLVRTMVAGAAGIDFALIVIAGDDGVMPQTREHLEILQLLGLRRGLIVVTKCDRIDVARRAAVAREIAATVAETPFSSCAMAFVSATTGDGVNAVREALVQAAASRARHPRHGTFRLPIDRSFNLAGIGTVATGTALCGRVAVGDEVVLLPGGRRARVRSVHAQNREMPSGTAGERCALALAGSGIGKDTVSRGSWICGDGGATTTQRFDADLFLLSGEKRPLRDWTPVHLHCGASDVPARVVVLAESLAPGQRGLAQIVLDEALPLRHGDRFVLRDQSGQRTIGGGTVLDPRATLRRRRVPERLARLEAMRPSSPEAALRGLLALDPGIEDLASFAVDRGLSPDEAEVLRTELDLTALRAGLAIYVFSTGRWQSWAGAVVAFLAAFHADHPDLPGIAGERLRLALRPVLPKDLFTALRERLAADKRVVVQGHWIRLPDHVAELSVDDRRIAALVMPIIGTERFRPPRVRDLGRDLGLGEGSLRRTCKTLVRAGHLVEVAHDHFFLRSTVVEMADVANALTHAHGVFSAADFRNELDNGRKVAIQVLEYFDRHGLTRREGDLRRVVKGPDLIFPRLEPA